MKKTLSILLLVALFWIPTKAQASFVRTSRGSIKVEGVVLTVTESTIYNLRRIKGKTRHFRWRRVRFDVKISTGVQLHKKSKILFKKTDYPLHAGKIGKSPWFSRNPSVSLSKKKGVSYPRWCTLVLFVKRGKSMKKVTHQIQWRLLPGMGRRGKLQLKFVKF